MIRRRKRPNPRTQREKDLRAGLKTPHTTPEFLAQSDVVLYRVNHNPFREGTDEHATYEEVFDATIKDLSECAIATLARVVPGLHRGLPTSSECPTKSSHQTRT